MHRRFVVLFCAVLLAASASPGSQPAPRSLDIYFIDVEGGQSTLIVTPDRHALLVDTGFPGDGTFTSKPGDPHQARDANRILTAVRDAKLTRIDDLLVTHYHADHVGGVTELASQIPIETFIDHGSVQPAADSVAGTVQAYRWYEAVRARGRHLEPKPGERLPLKGLDVTILSAAGATLAAPLPGAGEVNQACGATPPPPQEPNENPNSMSFVLRYGRFTFLDMGDVTGAPLFALVCPKDMVGRVDAYLVAHHGGADAADPATFAAFRPRVAIVDNGPRKGGAPNLLAALRALPGVDTWQLHHSLLLGGEDTAPARIANLDETTSHWIKLTARPDGSFTITNPRTAARVEYPAATSLSGRSSAQR